MEMGGVIIHKINIDELNGIYLELATLIGVETTLQIFEQYKGQQITFPIRLYSREAVRNKIIDEFNGNNYKQLAKKYDYSERWIRTIVKQKN